MTEQDDKQIDKNVDEDWKERARLEKEALDKKFKEEVKKQEEASTLPPASLLTFLSGLATQTLIQLGEIANPFTKKKEVSLDEARYSIDLLGILKEKTEGNLAEDEAKYLEALLYDLRMRFVAHTQQSPKKDDTPAG